MYSPAIWKLPWGRFLWLYGLLYVENSISDCARVCIEWMVHTSKGWPRPPEKKMGMGKSLKRCRANLGENKECICEAIGIWKCNSVFFWHSVIHSVKKGCLISGFQPRIQILENPRQPMGGWSLGQLSRQNMVWAAHKPHIPFFFLFLEGAKKVAWYSRIFFNSSIISWIMLL